MPSIFQTKLNDLLKQPSYSETDQALVRGLLAQAKEASQREQICVALLKYPQIIPRLRELAKRKEQALSLMNSFDWDKIVKDEIRLLEELPE